MMIRIAAVLLLLTVCACGSGGGADVPAADAGAQPVDASGTYYVKRVWGNGCAGIQASQTLQVVQGEGQLTLSSEEQQWEASFVPTVKNGDEVSGLPFNGSLVLFCGSAGGHWYFSSIYVDEAMVMYNGNPLPALGEGPESGCTIWYGLSPTGELETDRYPVLLSAKCLEPQ
jgi:predicted small lipoprotein YifL